MARDSDQSIYWRLFIRYSGILTFFALIAVMNLLTLVIADPGYHSVVDFLNETIWLLLTLSFLFFIGAVFRMLPFPLNLPSPVLTASASLFLVAFLFRITFLAGDLFGVDFAHSLTSVAVMLGIVVFFVVLTVGYIHILRPVIVASRTGVPACREKRHPTREEKERITWEDVEREFRYAAYDILQKIREELRPEERR